MNRRPWSVVAALVFAVASTTVLVSCKQGEGERCQLTSDCEDGLVCGSAGGGTDTQTCREQVPPGSTPDAQPMDGGPSLDGGQ